MEEDINETIIVRPGDPDYEKYIPEIDALGGKPIPLVAGLRFAENELHKLKKMKRQGYKNTLPELPDGSGEEIGVRPIDERIAELEKMFSDIKEVIDWAEAKRPGSSKNENGSLILIEYEKETGKKV